LVLIPRTILSNININSRRICLLSGSPLERNPLERNPLERRMSGYSRTTLVVTAAVIKIASMTNLSDLILHALMDTM